METGFDLAEYFRAFQLPVTYVTVNTYDVRIQFWSNCVKQSSIQELQSLMIW